MIRNRIQLLFGMGVSSGQGEEIEVSSFWWAQRNRAVVCLMTHVGCHSRGYNPWRWIIWTQDTLLSRHEVLWAEVDPFKGPQLPTLLGVAFPSRTRSGCIVTINDFVSQKINLDRWWIQVQNWVAFALLNPAKQASWDKGVGRRQHHSGKSCFNFNFYSALTIFPHYFVTHSKEREQSNKSKISSNKAPQCFTVVGGGILILGGSFFSITTSFAPEFEISEGRRKFSVFDSCSEK